MEKVISELESYASWKQTLRISCRNNMLKTSFANSLTPIKIRGLYQRLLKTYQSNQEKARTCWFQNQLRAFHWILIIVSAIHNVLINDFSETEWQLLSEIFKYKQKYVLQYQAIRLNPKKSILSRTWNKQQQEILKGVICEKQISNKWNDVARSLFKQSQNKFYRTGKQCRERWLNHLDPKKKRGEWTDQEDKTISKFILDQGKKWSQIARVLGHSRTQHMVKNRFKSLIIRQKKYHPKISSQNQLLKSVLNQNSVKRQNISSNQQEHQEEQYSNQNENVQQQKSQQQENQQRDDYVEREKIKIHPVQTRERFRNQNKGFSICSIPSVSENIIRQQRSQISLLSPGCDITQLDPNLRATLIQNDRSTEDKQDNMNNSFELQQVFSPFCVSYTPNGNLTPIYSPPPSIPFFMGFGGGSFSQGCMNNFGFFMNHSNNQGNNNNNDGQNE